MSAYDPYSSAEDDGLSARKPNQTSTAWMLTVADLFSLMLTFFVLLYSMSVIQHDKWDAISESLMQRLQQPIDEEVRMTTPSDFSMMRADFTYARGLDYLNTIIGKRFTNAPEMRGVIVTHGEDRLTLSLVSDSMFAKGSAEMSPDARDTMRRIGQFLANIGNRITIEGHTDPSPIHSKSYPSNWELSLARAITVANAMHEAGYPYAIDVYGLGSSRYDDLKGLSPAKRDELSRRVDIIVRETVAKH